MSKEETKKIILGSFGLIALFYVYFAFFLGPLNRSRHNMEGRVAELRQKIASSKAEMANTSRLEANARAATTRYDALRSLSADGAPIAWFPPRIRTFFLSQHIDKATARLDSTATPSEKELSSWGRYTWAIDLPQTDFSALGRALAALENSEPLLGISQLKIHAGTEDPELQQVTLIATMFIYKK